MKAVLSRQMAKHLQVDNELVNSTFFNQICIKDSSKFKLPDSMEKDYPGYGYDKENQPLSMMNIQYEYDLLSGNWSSLEFTKVTRNDQADSKETIDRIKKKSLYIRDLGYVTSTYLKAIDDKEAYYVNRLPHTTNIYQMHEGVLQLIDWKSLHKKMDKAGQTHKEMEVYMGRENKLKTRMVMFKVDQKTYQNRIHKATERGKRTGGYSLSKEYKAKAHYSIFITNVSSKNLSASQIKNIYKLRWQIEIIFKAWKSHVKIHSIKKISKERFECQFYAKFIWILLYWRVFQVANLSLQNQGINIPCSVIKFYIRAKWLTRTFKILIRQENGIYDWLKSKLLSFSKMITVETKKGKLNQYQLIMNTIMA